jgi:DNA-binding IclR family transcriptional regulator
MWILWIYNTRPFAACQQKFLFFEGFNSMENKGHRLLQNTLEILNYVADSPNPVVFKDIQEQFALPRSTIYSLLQTLLLMQYLEKDFAGRYSIGIRCFRTGSSFQISNPFERRARDIVEKINAACKETTHFAVLQGTDIVYIHKFESVHALRVHSQVGKALPAHATALGKAMLSGYSDEEIYSFYGETELTALTPKTITSLKVLMKQIGEVRRTSIAYDEEESTPKVKCVAVPVFDSNKKPVAGVSVSFPVYYEDREVENVIPLLLEAKKELEKLRALYK